jgi:hypothetical protein
VGHICNPSYSGGRDQEDHDLRLPRQKVLENPISANEKVSWAWWCSATPEVINKRIAVQANPGINARSY